MSKRLVCIVEGKGEVEAIPNLCSRILNSLSAHDWFVDKAPIRRPRSQLVDARTPGPQRPCHAAGLTKALAMASARKPSAVLVICDSDDDCPVSWSKSVPRTTQSGEPVAAVMPVREFEGWFLWRFDPHTLSRTRAADPEKVRDAKGRLATLIPGYGPTTHQLEMTRSVDITCIRERSRSFRKLVETLEAICLKTQPAPVQRRSR
ncbi:DUF4276 family protein [Corallococcus coralloides]|nr:DUF4276 family protein [Corallococcus coralloides]